MSHELEALQNIGLGVAGNIATSLLGYLLSSLGKNLIGSTTLAEWKLETTALSPIIKRALDEAGERIEWEGSPSLEELCIFISTPDVESIIRQFFSTNLSNDENNTHCIEIETQFGELFRKTFNLTDKKKSDLVYNFIIKCCEASLKSAIDQGVLSAHEAMACGRHKLVQAELLAIHTRLISLTEGSSPKKDELILFEKKLRQQVVHRLRYITPPFVDSAIRVPIDEIFVEATLGELKKHKKYSKQDNLQFICTRRDFLKTAHRAVVLGNPGGGKTTFAQKICHELATDNKKTWCNRHVVPVVLTLRHYAEAKRLHRTSIVQFIETVCNSDLQLATPANMIVYMLNHGRLGIVFDGLDELIDTTGRKTISNDVESFCSMFPSTSVIVTSRSVGYAEAPLDETFLVYQLLEFKPDQVSEYAEKWFLSVNDNIQDRDTGQKSSQEMAMLFFKESSTVPDLRTNPLMLGLMCNIYRGSNYIPKNRPDIYEKCANMLFEKWDKSRGILVHLPFEEHVRPAMNHLAFWIFSNNALQKGVTELQLIKETVIYLLEYRFEDEQEAHSAAIRFIEFCRGRAWIFTDTGTTPEGERLYQFTHRTFLEYFTAAHLARIHDTPEGLFAALEPKISRKEWDIVAQLAFQIKHRNLQQGGDRLLSLLLNSVGSTFHGFDDKQLNRLAFGIRCLMFMVPTPITTRKITTMALSFATNNWPSKNGVQKSVALINYLYRAADENRKTIIDQSIKIISELKFASEFRTAYLRSQDSIHSLRRIDMIIDTPESRDIAQQIFSDVWETQKEGLEALAKTDLAVAKRCLLDNRISLADFVHYHGAKQLLYSFDTTTGLIQESFVLHLLYKLNAYHFPSEILLRSAKFSEFGRVMENLQHPWFVNVSKARSCSPGSFLTAAQAAQPTIEFCIKNSDPDVLWGIIAILLVNRQLITSLTNTNDWQDLSTNLASWLVGMIIFSENTLLRGYSYHRDLLLQLGISQGRLEIIDVVLKQPSSIINWSDHAA